MPAATASSPSRPSTSPGRHSNGNASVQMSGVFGKCSEPIPTNVSSIRQQQQAAMRVKSNVDMKSVGGEGSPFDASFQQNKTVGKPCANATLKKKAGSGAKADDHIFTAPSPAEVAAAAPKVRTTQHHTDPFSEDRVREEGHKRKILTPESVNKAPKVHSVRIASSTKAKWESPYAAADGDEAGFSSSSVASGGLENSPVPCSLSLSPSRTSHCAASKSGIRCSIGRNDNHIFSSPDSTTDNGISREGSPSSNNTNNNSRFKYSSQGMTTMLAPISEAELQKDKANHKRIVNPPTQSMEGVFTVVEKKSRHPNYKFTTPFARQSSIAASARVGGRRHKNVPAAIRAGEVVTPFATTCEGSSPSPSQSLSPSLSPAAGGGAATYAGATTTTTTSAAPLPTEYVVKSRKVFAEAHSTRTPYARVSSKPPSHQTPFSRRVFKQRPTAPFATSEDCY